SGKVHEVRTDTGVTCAAKTLKLPVQLGDDQTPSCREREKPAADCGIPTSSGSCTSLSRSAAKVVVFMELLERPKLGEVYRQQAAGRAKDSRLQRAARLLYLHSQQPPLVSQRHSELHGARAARKRESRTCVQYSRERTSGRSAASVFQMTSGARPFSKCSNPMGGAELLRESGAAPLPCRMAASAELQDFYSRCTAQGSQSEKIRTEELLAARVPDWRAAAGLSAAFQPQGKG
uniref:CC71L protein n=1 Tax=Macrostomum lignano TaxID=282301 RepID=A0A1I8FF94_9PLAT